MNRSKLKNLNSKYILLAVLIVSWLVFGMINREILSVPNFISLIRSSIIPLMLALPQMLIIALGGIDMAFTVVTSISSYCALYLFYSLGYTNPPLIIIFLLALAVSVICYVFIWFFIDKVKISAFITTLGANSLFKGAVLAFIGTSYVNTLPDILKKLGTTNLLTVSSSNGTQYALHFSIIIVFVLYVILYFVMEKTKFGREVYAIGADEDSAKRAGMNISRIRFIVMMIAAFLCAMTGLLHDTLSRFSMPLPTDIVGKELNSIAAVVIGIGVSKKAEGIVIGTFLGVLLLQTVSTNLVMLGVPGYYQQFVSGIIILIGLCCQTIKLK